MTTIPKEARALLVAIQEADGAEIYRNKWLLAEQLRDCGLITLGSPRGPGGHWRRAELVKAPVEEATRGLTDGPFTVEMCPHGCSEPSGCDICMAPPQYPEHEKLKAISEKSQTCGEFLAWLQETYTLGQYHTHSDACRDEDGDPWRCDMSSTRLYAAVPNTRRLLAEFFKIDEAKIEEEKRAVLDELRGQVSVTTRQKTEAVAATKARLHAVREGQTQAGWKPSSDAGDDMAKRLEAAGLIHRPDKSTQIYRTTVQGSAWLAAAPTDPLARCPECHARGFAVTRGNRADGTSFVACAFCTDGL